MLELAPVLASAAYVCAFVIALLELGRALRVKDLSGFRRSGDAKEVLLVVLAVGLHAYWLVDSLFAREQAWFGFAPALSAMLLVAATGYLVESRVASIGAIRLVVLPLAAITVLLPLAFPGVPLTSNRLNTAFGAHFVLALLAYGLLAIAALHALAMAVIDVVLHAPRTGTAIGGAQGWRSVVLELSPPLLAMEELLFRTLGLGFIALTLTLITGIGFHEVVFGRPLRFDHKTVFSIVSWSTFAILLFGRWRYGWRGRAALRYVFSGFVLLLLAYVGTHFVLEVILGRR